jgi:tetratricopeptide (TPR) repeat protein
LLPIAGLGCAKDESEAHANLGSALAAQGKLPEAVAAYREAIRLQPDLSEAHANLGLALLLQGKVAEARAACQEALRLKPDFPKGHNNLGGVLRRQGELPEAVAAYREAIRLQPDFPEAHSNLGNALAAQGKLPEAVAAYREAIRLQPNLSKAHTNLGAALRAQGKLAEAVAACREAIRLQPDLPEAHANLGLALLLQGKVAEARAACQEALRLKPDYPKAHNHLGSILRRQGKLAEAVAAFQKATRLQPDFPEAHANLGLALRDQGKFRASLASLRRAHELGTRRPGWPSARSAADVRRAERLVELDRDFPAFLAGERQPAGPDEQLELAALCGHPAKRLSAAAARFAAAAFAARPALSDDLRAGHRYNAACCAALAGCGRGTDAARLNAKERAGWRRQAQDWLRADLVLHAKRLEGGRAADRREVQQTMQGWLADARLAGVRGAKALAELPAEERQGWAVLWAEAEALRQQAREKTK